MISDLARIGDKVTVHIPAENREWGYNPCPDGTKATILSFAEIHYGRLQTFGNKPGVYENTSWANILLETGKTHCEMTGRLRLINEKEEKRRLASLRRAHKKNPDLWPPSSKFIRDLPETKFWEGDIVKIPEMTHHLKGWSDEGTENFQVVSIDYNYIDQKTDYGLPYPFYVVSSSIGAGWSMSARESQMILVERGPVWKHYHNEPIEFKDISEEASFFSRLGHTDEVRNPDTQTYSWTKDEVLSAIRNDIAHGMSISGGLFGGGASVRAIRFRDEDLGKRIAKATLEGFKE